LVQAELRDDLLAQGIELLAGEIGRLGWPLDAVWIRHDQSPRFFSNSRRNAR
jgi:hypothetical protein